MLLTLLCFINLPNEESGFVGFLNLFKYVFFQQFISLIYLPDESLLTHIN